MRLPLGVLCLMDSASTAGLQVDRATHGVVLQIGFKLADE